MNIHYEPASIVVGSVDRTDHLEPLIVADEH